MSNGNGNLWGMSDLRMRHNVAAELRKEKGGGHALVVGVVKRLSRSESYVWQSYNVRLEICVLFLICVIF